MAESEENVAGQCDPPLTLYRPLVLVGLMGSGKTSVGRRLAGMLGVQFVDSDSEIEAAAGMSIPEIFESLGEAAFRDGERRVICRLLKGGSGIIATGGGAFMDPATRSEIADASTSVWLRADLDLLWDRVRDRPGRPLLDTADPRAVLESLDAARAPVYGLADVTVDSIPGATHEAMARRIVGAVRAFDRSRPEGPSTLGVSDI